MRRVVLNLRDDRPAWALPDDAAATIAAAFPADEWDVIDVSASVSGRGDGGGVSDEALAAVVGAEVWIGYGFPRALIDRLLEAAAGATAAPSAGVSTLRWIHSAAAGVRSMLHPELVAGKVVITNSAGVHAEPIAETVIGALHYFARGFDFAVAAQPRHEWHREAFDQRSGAVRELGGATLGVLGYGGIGRAVARRAIALGMRVIALRSGPRPAEDGVTNVHGDQGLDRLLATSDYVAVALPSTAATHQLLDARRIALLRADAVVVNVGRGDTVDQAALTRALVRGALRGAALDVFEHEPLPPESPLWDLENVLILPHVSATSPRFWEREVPLIVENAQRYQRGADLQNVVDKVRGY